MQVKNEGKEEKEEKYERKRERCKHGGEIGEGNGNKQKQIKTVERFHSL